MSSPIVEKILRDGVSSLNVGMLAPAVRAKLLGDAGDRLLHTGELLKAAEAYTVGGCTEKLKATGAWLLEQKRYGVAAHFLRPVGKPEELERLAAECVAAGEIEAAKALYRELGQHEMVRFLEENLGGLGR